MKYLINGLILFSFCLTIFIGCDDQVAGNDLKIPDSNVSYSQHIQPLFNKACATSGCHDDITMADGISLTTWSGTTADPSVVFPGEPDNSKLVWAIEGRAGIPAMPPPGYPAYLTENQINGIKTWIDEGAKNN